ncbi:epidermal growth factor receptor substrate 15-like 1 isoform X2 [Macrosteles quadrilineatus]|uniref:epidermal growth factor receptor substrate 15-like 1 isoform X2 n=1 Tax=Macrosteles quadrilineatus TaxID=74068 RepID=UPI0023E3108E|nr:epidermal growth factor receptor substrate 15-like 1 isoform X2 [Macrosteles quadrilineatus]
MKMAALPSPTQVAGNHNPIYESYYLLVDPNNHGSVGALDAAKFLKKSGLSDGTLSKIWDLSDPNGKGYLNKPGFFVALKLVSLAQNGRDVNIANILTDVPPPKMADVPAVLHNNIINSVQATLSDWAVKPHEREKYDQLFDSLQPLNGVIPGNKVKGLLLDSKLPMDTLGKIWDLADMDKDGSLDRHEFVVAMHLVYKALEKYAIPNSVPPELLPPGKRKDPLHAAPAPIIPIAPITKPVEHAKPAVPPAPQAPWVVSAEERQRYDVMFHHADVDKDGFVSGHEIKNVFLQSGVPQQVLAHIWGLCDMKQTGKLNGEQFALAMWLISQKLQGKDPPPALTPEMIPPSARGKSAENQPENNNTTPYSNPELDMISKDIEQLVREKQILEGEIIQKEADIKIKNGEVKSLQGELDTLAATLKQLETQKGEAQKRLNDLKNQVDNLRRQAEEQESNLKAQEEELSNKKQELEGLKQEESRLQQQQEEFGKKLDTLSQNLQDSQLQISQVKASITQLEEHQRQIQDAIGRVETASTSGDVTSVPDTCLHLQPEFRDPSHTKLVSEQLHDPSNDAFTNGPTGDNFMNNNFANDPFSNPSAASNQDPFASSGGFAADFNKPVETFAPDPFASAFGSSISNGKSDPFDPFGDGRQKTSKTPQQEEAANKDPFGCDPFAILHAPTRDSVAVGPPPRPESPSPALPPKKSKVPPPRPAPPRPLQPPTPSPTPADPFNAPAANSTSDPFGSDPFASSNSFADFSNFNSKFAESPVRAAPAVPSVPSAPAPSAPAPPVPKLDFTEDPFRDYRYEDPFNFADPFDDEDGSIPSISNSSAKLDPFGMEIIDSGKNTPVNGKLTPTISKSVNGKKTPMNGKNTPSPLPSEDQQLAWAAAESLRLEEERRKQAEREKADLELALALSKKEKKRSGPFSKILS